MARLVLDDVIFCLGLRRVSGTIQIAEGIPFFAVDGERTVLRLPFNPAPSSIGVRCDAFVRTGANQIILEPGPDDVPISEIADNEIDVSTSLDEVESLIEEQRIRAIMKLSQDLISIVLFLIVEVIFGLLFFLKKIPIKIGTIIIGVAALLAFITLLRIFSTTKTLNSSKVYDTRGNWVDLNTRHTSLNGGYYIPDKEEAKAF